MIQTHNHVDSCICLQQLTHKIFVCVYFAVDKLILNIIRRGARPEVHSDAAGGLLRAILISLDDLKITEKTEKGGRRVTRIGQQALDLVAGQVAHSGEN